MLAEKTAAAADGAGVLPEQVSATADTHTEAAQAQSTNHCGGPASAGYLPNRLQPTKPHVG